MTPEAQAEARQKLYAVAHAMIAKIRDPELDPQKLATALAAVLWRTFTQGLERGVQMRPRPNGHDPD